MMREVVDAFGAPVQVGDYLVHVTKLSTAVKIAYMRVYEVIQTIDGFKLRVAGVTRGWKTLYSYKATLVTNNFVRVDGVPTEIKKLLED